MGANHSNRSLKSIDLYFPKICSAIIINYTYTVVHRSKTYILEQGCHVYANCGTDVPYTNNIILRTRFIADLKMTSQWFWKLNASHISKCYYKKKDYKGLAFFLFQAQPAPWACIPRPIRLEAFLKAWSFPSKLQDVLSLVFQGELQVHQSQKKGPSGFSLKLKRRRNVKTTEPWDHLN